MVPGAWHGSIHMRPLIEHLSSRGYPSIALDLPTADASPPDKGLYDDIAFLASHLEELVATQGKDVIVIVHSYSGLPGSSAARPFVKKDRAQKGEEGGVIGVLYISSWALPAGKTVMDAGYGMNADWMKVDVCVSSRSPAHMPITKHEPQGPISTVANAAHIFYNDLSPSDAEFYVSHLTTHCVIATIQPAAADCCGGVVPTTYLICERDNAMPIHVQERNTRNLGEECKIVRCDAGHSPFLSRVEFVGDVIRRMAGEDV